MKRRWLVPFTVSTVAVGLSASTVQSDSSEQTSRHPQGNRR